MNPRTNGVARSGELCQGPQRLVATANAVWVTCTKDNVLLRLDPKTLKAKLDIAVAADGVWTSSFGENLVRRVDVDAS